MSGRELAFWADTIVAVFSALMVILHRNPVVSALSLVAHLCSVAIFFLLLDATFLFVVQIILYAGAIMVLFLFVIMLVDPGGQGVIGRAGRAQMLLTLVGALLLLLAMGRAALSIAGSGPAEVPEGYGGIASVGQLLFTDYLFPFEVASILLLVAMMGALYMGRKEAD